MIEVKDNDDRQSVHRDHRAGGANCWRRLLLLTLGIATIGTMRVRIDQFANGKRLYHLVLGGLQVDANSS
jgi:hypothetical protein